MTGPRFEVLERGRIWRILDRRYGLVEYVGFTDNACARLFVALEVEHRAGVEATRRIAARKLGRHIATTTHPPAPITRPATRAEQEDAAAEYAEQRRREDDLARYLWNAYLGRPL